jgi:hypothetical protein
MESIEVHAVELVREIRDKQMLELQGKSPAEQIAYYHEKARQFHAKLAKRAKKRKAVVAATA